jgi:hypothetical protein
MVLPVVNRFVHCLGNSNGERRIRIGVAEVERFEGVGGNETVL